VECIHDSGGKARRKETTSSGTRWKDNIKTDLGEREDGVIWTEFIKLRIGTSGGVL
jgi:hypothetical protein